MMDEYRTFVKKRFTSPLAGKSSLKSKWLLTLPLTSALLPTEKFFCIIGKCPEIVLTRDHLEGLTNDNIKQLVQMGLLANHRIIGKWLLSVPNVGVFVTSFVKARKAVLRMIKATKLSEIGRNELETKKLPKFMKLGMKFMVLDLIGSDTVIR